MLKVLVNFDNKAAILINVSSVWMLTETWSWFYEDLLQYAPHDTRFDDPASLAARYLIFLSAGEPFHHRMRIVDPAKEYGQDRTAVVYCDGNDAKLELIDAEVVPEEQV